MGRRRNVDGMMFVAVLLLRAATINSSYFCRASERDLALIVLAGDAHKLLNMVIGMVIW